MFHGNQYTKKAKAIDVSVASTSNADLDVSAAFASLQKLQHAENILGSNFCINTNKSASGNTIIDMNVLCSLLGNILEVFYCEICHLAVNCYDKFSYGSLTRVGVYS
jgi:hypothetical protein